MTVFNEYARYYDLLYRDKDYQTEADYIHSLIQAHAPGAKSVLNLGCGSGRHDRCLTKLGYTVTGVDLSEEMLACARAAATGDSSLEYVQGDVRTMRLQKQYDVVIALFHVMSYQVSNADLKAAFATARAHLRTGGLFLFDCWYGPGGLSDRPSRRVKELEDDNLRVTRIAEPVLHANENLVDVNYHVSIRCKSSGELQEIRETHRMRYLFIPEIIEYLSAVDLEHLFSKQWLSASEPGDMVWYLCCGARSISPTHF